MTTEATAQQPRPTGAGTPIAPLVCADIMARNDMGRQKYGDVLRAHNGRDPLVDLYQELLDGAQYVRQELEERRLRGQVSLAPHVPEEILAANSEMFALLRAADEEYGFSNQCSEDCPYHPGNGGEAEDCTCVPGKLRAFLNLHEHEYPITVKPETGKA